MASPQMELDLGSIRQMEYWIGITTVQEVGSCSQLNFRFHPGNTTWIGVNSHVNTKIHFRLRVGDLRPKSMMTNMK